MKKYMLVATTAALMTFSAAAFATDNDQVAALPTKQDRTILRPAAVQQALTDQGYAQVRKLRYWNGVYQAQVLQPGKGWVKVVINPGTGRSVAVN